ncbi:MAG: TIGR02281 family clan AA aspartic protease [Hyphomicrobiales bacterium]|nr:TIGR02281 family clan AA aspartic protease [Hyphomicrobiales bacterium]
MGKSVGKALRETGVWAAAFAVGGLSFLYFEDAYLATRGGFETSERSAGAADITGSVEALIPHEQHAAPAKPRVAQPRLIIDAASWTPIVVPAEPEPKSVAVQANSHGHFHVDATINGKPVELMTDTGATYVALSYETAVALGLGASLKFTGRSSTANGVARVAPVTLAAVRVGDIEVRNVAAVVAEAGRMNQNLLGMSFIRALSKFELRGDKLVLTQ